MSKSSEGLGTAAMRRGQCDNYNFTLHHEKIVATKQLNLGVEISISYERVLVRLHPGLEESRCLPLRHPPS